MLLPVRGRLEILIAGLALACVLTAVLWRADGVADDTLRQRAITAGAHFQAGISLLQARSRVGAGGPLNALGYPTGTAGRLSRDDDCATIWQRVMAEPAAVEVRFVPDRDGGGDRCEFLLGPAAGSAASRILYWPLGATASVVSIGDRTARVVAGEHVFVDSGVRRPGSGESP